MEKTIKEWLEELPEPYRTQALKNANQMSFYSLHEALHNAFIWSTTKQGQDYWNNLYDELEADQFAANHKEEQQYEAEQEDKGGLEDGI